MVFPIITNSEGKYYEVKIFTRDGIKDNDVSFKNDNNYFQAIYSFPISYLRSNKILIPKFIFEKIVNYSSFIAGGDVIEFLAYLICLSFIFSIYLIYKEKHRDDVFKFSLGSIRKIDKPLIFLSVFYLLTHIQFLNYSQYWDAANYFAGVVSVSKSILDFGHFLENFNFQGHPSMGYVALMALSQNVQNNNVYLLNLENLILAVMSIWAFYYIFLYFFNNRKIEALFLTAIFAFNPLFYATSISLNLDFPVLVFETLAICMFLYKKYFWFVIFSILMIFSKETGILIFGSFIGLYFLIIEIKRLIHSRKLDYKKILTFIIPILLFILYLSSNHWKLWSNTGSTSITGSSSFVWNDNGFFNFGLNSINVSTRLVQMFVMNFSWILSAIIMLSIFKSQVFGENILANLSDERRDLIRIFIWTMVIFVIFNLIYIVMPFSRYVVENAFFLTLISYVCLDYLLPKFSKIKIAILVALSLLFISQTFKMIDPSVQILYGKRQMANNTSSPFLA